VSYVFAGIATLVGGLPAYLYFRRVGLVTWWSAIILGLLIGSVAAWVTAPTSRSLGEFFVFGLLGIASAAGFWLVWKLGERRVA